MERSGFFDANLVGETYDRVYLAAQFAAYFASFIASGVYAKHGNALQVMASAQPQMQVQVESGQGWIKGYWYENSDVVILPIDVADGISKRIDSVVLRLRYAERDMILAVKKGTPDTVPKAPALQRDADYYELQLATILIDAGAVNIQQANITDTRMDASVCGWVTGVVEQLDFSSMQSQFDDYLKTFKDTTMADITSWFDTIKGQLSGDIAVSLQMQVTSLFNGVAKNYDSKSTYQAGEVRFHEGVLYKSKQTISPAEEFDSSHWDKATIGDLLAAYNANNKVTEIQVVDSLPPDASSHPTTLYLIPEKEG